MLKQRFFVVLIFSMIIFVVLFNSCSSNQPVSSSESISYRDSIQYYQLISKIYDHIFLGQFTEADSLIVKLKVVEKNDKWVSKLSIAVTRQKNQQEFVDSIETNWWLSVDKIEKQNLLLEEYSHEIDQKTGLLENTEEQLVQKQIQIENQAKKLHQLETEIEQLSNSFGQLIFKIENGVEVTYTGYLVNGMANGYGVGIFNHRGIYQGDWKDNLRHGKGKYTWSNGDIYSGEYVNGKREGQGTYYFTSGQKYEGQWKNDLREGTGILYSEEGNVLLKGEWRGDKYIKNPSSG